MTTPRLWAAAARVARRRWLLPVLAVWALAGPLAARAPSERDELRAALEAVLAEEGLQTELPEAALAEPEPEPVAPLVRGLSSLLLWVGGLALLGFAGWQLVRRWRPPVADPAPPQALAPNAEPATRAAADGDALAAAGRWDEALRVLLDQTLASLGAQDTPPGRTSRERVAGLGLPADPTTPLSRLLQVVEDCLFGGAAADERAWRAAREAAGKALASAPAEAGRP